MTSSSAKSLNHDVTDRDKDKMASLLVRNDNYDVTNCHKGKITSLIVNFNRIHIFYAIWAQWVDSSSEVAKYFVSSVLEFSTFDAVCFCELFCNAAFSNCRKTF